MADTAERAGTRSKLRRVTQACDYCHARSIKCELLVNDIVCQNCRRFEQQCTYHRRPRKRGAKPRNPDSSAPTTSNSGAARDRRLSSLPVKATHRRQEPLPAPDGTQSLSVLPFIASQEVIMDLTELYFEIVYPIFPFFHRPSWMYRISRAQYTTDKELYATTMAVCALVSSRVRDGSVTNPKWDVGRLRQPKPEVFYAEARKQLASLDTCTSLNVLRARAILAIAAIQNGDMREMRWQLGMYHSLVAADGLHDEVNWPSKIGVIEREERRRLFWSIYTFDIFTSSVSNRVIVSREEQCNVLYPAEINDELITDNSDLDQAVDLSNLSSRKRPSLEVQSQCWLSGWNFITDVYRILEHALSKFRNVRPHKRTSGSVLQDIFQDSSTLTEATIQDTVLQMYKRLPLCFREIPEITCDIEKDRVSFQAANILGSVQLLRIVLCVAGDTSIEHRCRVAGDVVDALVQTPVAYSLAISAPLLHHLSGIGVILGSVLEEPLSESDYSKVRSIILLMCQMLEKMEPIQHAAGASEKLKNMVARIDEYVKPRHQRDDAAPTAALQNGPSELVDGLPMEPGLGHTENIGTGFEAAMGADVPEDWLIQVPPDLLGDWGWDFDFV
ncbi:hypothetical protein CC79DRAFT_676228 [Sarocladium strictum]